MAKKLKKAFTITELVIVIAVIAILAAVLIPTFSNIINRANESADIQAVREMNVALANDEALNGKPESVGEVADVLRGIGYDVRNYRPLGKSNVNYWYKEDNRVILYNSGRGEIVYPEEYTGLTVTNDGSWSLLNETYTEASNFDFESAEILQEDGSYDFSKAATGNDPSQTAKQYVGTALFALATQINEGKIENNVNVALPAEVELPDYDWVPIKEFEGTIKPAEGVATATISNLNLSNNTLYSESTNFDGSGDAGSDGQSKYNVYGFINTVTGATTIENITFEDVTIEMPGSDFEKGVTSGSNANVVAPIGAILPGDGTVDVTIRNVHVKDSTIRGYGRVAGLVGYIGGFGGSDSPKIPKNSTVTIENCSVKDCMIEGGLWESDCSAYGSAGGLISYIVRVDGEGETVTEGLTVNINGCTVSGNTIKGRSIGGAVGWFNSLAVEMKIQGGAIQGNTFIGAAAAGSYRGAGIVVGYFKNSTTAAAEALAKDCITVSSSTDRSDNNFEGVSDSYSVVDKDSGNPKFYTVSSAA